MLSRSIANIKAGQIKAGLKLLRRWSHTAGRAGWGASRLCFSGGWCAPSPVSQTSVGESRTVPLISTAHLPLFWLLEPLRVSPHRLSHVLSATRLWLPPSWSRSAGMSCLTRTSNKCSLNPQTQSSSHIILDRPNLESKHDGCETAGQTTCWYLLPLWKDQQRLFLSSV